MRTVTGDTMTITSKDNGKTKLTEGIFAFNSVTAKWKDYSITPAGTLTFTVDGDAGEGGNVIDLGTGQRIITSNTRLAFAEITVSGLPEKAAVILYFR